MNKRFIAVLVFAFVVASVASLLLYRLMSSRQQVAKAAPTSVKIVLASRNLEVGTLLKESDLKLADWTGPVPNGASNRVQDVVGRGVTAKVIGEEPVLETRLAPKGAGGGLPSMIPSGMRAVAIRVNEVAGVAGFVSPGMHVDLIISGSPPGASGAGNLGTLAKTMLQNIEVLSAGQEIKKDAEGKPMLVQVVNLLVTPDQAEQVSLASSQTQVQLILRNPLDRQVNKTPGAAMTHLFTGGKLNLQDQPPRNAAGAKPRPRLTPVVAPYRPSPIEVRPEPRKPFTMEIINGTRRNETKFAVDTQEKSQ